MAKYCSKIKSLVDKYFEERINSRELSIIENHILECSSCRMLFENEKSLINSIKTIPEIECPEHIIRRIETETIGSRSEKSLIRKSNFQRISPAWRVAVATAAVVVVSVLMIINSPVIKKKKVEYTYSKEELILAEKKAKWSLAYIATILNETERSVLEDVVMKQLPETFKKCLMNTIFQGGQQ